MAFTEIAYQGQTIGTTRWSLATNTSFDAGDGQNTEGGVYFSIDVSAMAAGDVYELRFVKKLYSGGTQKDVWQPIILTGAQATPILILPPDAVKYAWDFTLQKVSGTDRAFDWLILLAAA